MPDKDVAVVTGAGRGIGFGIAQRLFHAGYRVVLLDLDRPALDDAVREIAPQARSTELLAIPTDVTDVEQVDGAVAKIGEAFGQIDVLVNNAGIVRDRRLAAMTESDWDAVIATNLKSQFLTCRAILPGMAERNYGRVINISSRAWLGGFGQANYSAAKGAVVSFTRSLAIEFAAKGITANVIAPGIVETQLFRSFRPDVQEKLKKTVPMQRIGTPDDVAEVALFFASRNNSYVTGQLVYVCGGRSLSSAGM